MATNIQVKNIGKKPIVLTVQQKNPSDVWADTADFTLQPDQEIPGNDANRTWIAVWLAHNVRRLLLKGQGSPVTFKSLNGVHELKVTKITAVREASKTLSVGKKLTAPVQVKRDPPTYVKTLIYYDAFPDTDVQFLIEENPT